MTTLKYQSFDEERAFYGVDGIQLQNCAFEGPADGESAFKEAKNITVIGCLFDLRYPFWHSDGITVTENTTMTENCRAALWYSKNIRISDSKLLGIKALRGCSDIEMKGTTVVSPEFGWKNSELTIDCCDLFGEYLFFETDSVKMKNTKLHGKYSFQYTENVTLEYCDLDTKDAFWHGKNITLRHCSVKGEYLAWYSENLTLEHCTIIGTQPLCYCKNLRLIDCTMIDTDLAFEKSEVEATLISSVVSIKNPLSGHITAPSVGEIIMDDPMAKGEITVTS